MQRGYRLLTFGLVASVLATSTAVAKDSTDLITPSDYFLAAQPDDQGRKVERIVTTNLPAPNAVGPNDSRKRSDDGWLRVSEVSETSEISEVSAISESSVVSELSEVSEVSTVSETSEVSQTSEVSEVSDVLQEPEIDGGYDLASGVSPVSGTSETSYASETSETSLTSETSETSETSLTSETSEVSDTSDPVTIASIFEEVAMINDFDHWLFSTRATVDGTADTPMTSAWNVKRNSSIPGNTRTPLISVNEGSRRATANTGDGDKVSAPEATSLNITSGYSADESLFTIWQSLRKDLAPRYANTFVAVEDGLIYLTNWHLSGASLGDQPAVRLRTGDADGATIGEATSELLAGASLDRVHRTFFYAHDKGLMSFGFDVEHAKDPANAVDATLSRIDVLSFKRDDLSGEMVQFYQGGQAGEDFTVLSGRDVPPKHGRTNFSDWEVYAEGTDEPVASVTPDSIQTELSGKDGATLLSWTGPELIPVPANKLVVMDVWISSPDNSLDGLGNVDARLTLSSAGNGRAESFTFSANDTERLSADGPVRSSIPVGPQSRRYTVIMDPQAVGQAEVEVLPMIEMLAHQATSTLVETIDAAPVDARNNDEPALRAPKTTESAATGRLQIDAVVITTYDLPTELNEEETD